MSYVAFAIDNNSDLHTVSKFTRFLDTKRAQGALCGGVEICTGYWEGFLETSYIMTEQDYMNHVVPSGYAREQACVLVIPSEVKQPCHLATATDLKFIEGVGVMREVSKDVALTLGAWTYNPTTGKYFATDTVITAAGADSFNS